jgi:hypothetical protein
MFLYVINIYCIVLKFSISNLSSKTKNAKLVVEAQLAHLHSLRVNVHDMVHVKVEAKAEIELTGAGSLTVGDWVEVAHDFSPGNNSGGGCGVIIEVTENLSHVRYIIDGHVEKLIPLKRLTMIPMPFRRDKAKLRTRSMRHLEPSEIENTIEKASRERLACHGFIEEAIVDTLNDNNEQAFRQLDKVQWKILVL